MTSGFSQALDYWRAGGPLLALIAAVCFAMWLFFLRSHSLLRQTIREGRLVEEALDRVPARQGAAAFEARLTDYPGGIAVWFRWVLADIQAGAPPAQAFAARTDDVLRLLRRDFVLLAALTTLAPLLGLLGTVTGMIQTFDAVAASAGHTGSRVAAGISQALITTQFGLVVALPGVFGLARLERLHRSIDVIMADCRAHALYALEASTPQSPAP